MKSLFREPSHNKMYFICLCVGLLYVLPELLFSRNNIHVQNILIGITFLSAGAAEWLPKKYILASGLTRIIGIACAAAVLFLVVDYFVI